jgi:hypothetical protein
MGIPIQTFRHHRLARCLPLAQGCGSFRPMTISSPMASIYFLP